MDLSLSPEQLELRRSARAFLTACCPTTVVRRLRAPEADREGIELLRKGCDLGWAGLSLPTWIGGGGGSLVDQAVLAEELGQTLFPTVLVSSVAAALALAGATAARQAVELLPGILDGSTPATVCWPDRRAARVRLSTSGGDAVVDGDAGLVADAMTAALLVVAAESADDGQTQLVPVPAEQEGVRRVRTLTLDGARHARVAFTHARVAPEWVLVGGQAACEALAHTLLAATALQCVEMVGIASAAFLMTSRYVADRQQFGRPIGSFQAVQHHVADMATELDAARLAAYQAAWCCGEARDAAHAVAVAKVAANRAARDVTLMAHQLHGGTGYTTEHDLHLFSDRAAAAMLSFGTTDEHIASLGQTMAATTTTRPYDPGRPP